MMQSSTKNGLKDQSIDVTQCLFKTKKIGLLKHGVRQEPHCLLFRQNTNNNGLYNAADACLNYLYSGIHVSLCNRVFQHIAQPPKIGRYSSTAWY